MARTLKEHDVRRAEILDMAQQLFYQKGYEQTSIQDLLNALGIAKGTFYHYFDSKQALLEEMVERLTAQGMLVVQAVMDDPTLSPRERFTQVFTKTHYWKVERKDFLLDLMKALYQDENLRLRQTLIAAASAQIVPLLAQIVAEGVNEGVFVTDYPATAAEVAFWILQKFGESLAELLLKPQPDALTILAHKINAYQQSVERVLGAAPGSLLLFDPAFMTEKWFA